jgi:hypothetical protein
VFVDINFLGRYAFTRADPAAGLRPFHHEDHTIGGAFGQPRGGRRDG